MPREIDITADTRHREGSALLLVDVVNDLEFPGGEDLLEHALPAARAIRDLVERARAADVPVIYANDNFGHWRSDFRALVHHCLEDGVRGEPVVRLLEPEEDDLFVLKPMHSAFHETPMERLLSVLGVEELVLTGFATDYCVLFTAMDAHMRGYDLVVPPDCVAAEAEENSRRVLDYLERALGARVSPAEGLELSTPRGSPT